MKGFGLWLLLMVFFTAPLPAQLAYWKHYELPNDLENADPDSFYESEDGRLWLTSKRGLLSFDGRSFKTMLDSEGQINQTRSVFEDEQRILWVGYESGKIDRLINGRLEAWEPEEGLPAVAITGFAQDNAGQIWFATYGEGVYVVAEGRLYNVNTDDGLPGNDVYTIKSDQEGLIWLGTDGGISNCSFTDGEKKIRNFSRAEGLMDEIVRVILPDSSGNFWIGTHDKGVAFFDRKTNRFSVPQSNWAYGTINDLSLLEGNWLYIATESNGAWRLSLRHNHLERLGSSINADSLSAGATIRDLHQDNEGGLWLISNKEGIRRTNQHLGFISIPEQNIQAVQRGKDGRLWLGTEQGLFQLVEDRQLLGSPGGKGVNIVSLFEDRFGNLWLGTFGEGLYIFNPASARQRHFGLKDGLGDGSILSIAGTDDRVLLASLGGVKEIKLSEDPLTVSELKFAAVAGLKTDFIYQITAGADGVEWYATDGEGIARREAGKITHLRKQITSAGDSVDWRTVYSLALSPNGNLWLNSPRSGLFWLDGKTLRPSAYYATHLLREVAGLASVGKDEVIVAHSEGLISINGTTGNAVVLGGEEVETFQFVPILNSLSRDQSGKVWIGGTGGLLAYDHLVVATANRSRTILRSVSVYPGGENKPDGNRFKHDENMLAFEFSGIWYTDPTSVRYRYQLEGYDPDWIETLDERAIYSKLPPGDYTFRIVSAVGGQWDGADEQIYRFTILLPYWRKWWFLLLVGGSLLAAGSYLVRLRDARLQREHQLQRATILSQYEALKSQINPHFLFNSFNTLVAMIEDQSPDAVTYTERLSDLFRSVLQYRDRETIPVSEELNLLKNYTFLMERRFGNKITIEIDLPPQQYFIVPLSLQLLVENAIKHNVVSSNRPLRVSIFYAKDDQFICVRNNRQPKLQQEPSTGFGLSSLSARYHLLVRTKMVVEDEQEYFQVCLPVLEKPVNLNN